MWNRLDHLTALILFSMFCLTVACASTGDPEADARRHAIVVLACKSQCPIIASLALDACDGKLDGEVTDKPGNTLYAVCISEAMFVALGCPVACDEIPKPKLAVPPDAEPLAGAP